MKKTLLAITLSTALLSGCMTTEGSSFKEQGEQYSNVEYVVTPSPALESIRMPVRSLFDAGKGIYDTYLARAQGNKDFQTFLSASEGKSEDEIKALFNSLPAASQKNITKFESANGDITKKLVGLGAQLLTQQAAFANVNYKNLLVEAGVSFLKMPNAMGAIKDTTNELSYLSGTIGQVKKISDTLDAMSVAQ